MSASGAATSLKNYRLVAEIGQGGMADVYLAVAQGPIGFNKLVVIKKIRRELANDPDSLAMFLDEARLAARLNHPNIVQTYEVGNEGDQYFIAMEYLEGKALNAARSKTHGGLPLTAQLRVISDVLAALEYAHELRDFDGTPLRIVHRDVSPQNVFVTYQGSIKLVDFGIAKAVDSSQQTKTGVVKGKVTYMAPEQSRGIGVDCRADVYAAGVLLWEAIADRRMWKNIPDITVVHRLMQGTVPAIREVVPDVPADLERICTLALAPVREDRYPSAAAMHADLEAYIARQPERSSAREIGAMLAARHAEDRARTHAVIESQLRDLRWSGTNPRVTSADLPNVGTPATPFTPSIPTRIESSGRQPGSFTAPGLVTSAGPGPRRPLVAFALGGVALLGAAAFGAHALLAGRGEDRIDPSPATSPAASAAPATTEAPATTARVEASDAAKPAATKVHLKVDVQPAGARVLLDGVLLSTGPYDGQQASADGPHVLRVEADRHVAREQKISLGGDLAMSVSLTPEGGGGRGRPAPPPPPARVTAEPAPPPTGQRPNREIDRDNPYGKKP